MNKVLQKFIADSGYCSRRKAEELIKNGVVRVNGETAELGARVGENDEVTVEGKKLSAEPEKKIYIKLNKPKGYVCTNRRFKNEKSVLDIVDTKERVFTAGRLDKESRGLVLLSNDGDWVYEMTHPSFEHEKEYEVELDKPLSEAQENKIVKEGVNIGEKRKARAKDIEKIDEKKYKVILKEGKKRQIRRMFRSLNRKALDLKRVRVGEYKMGKLKEGDWRFV